MLTGDVGPETLNDFAQMVHTELLMIDADSTPPAFADRVRWNQAYYRLAEGLPGRR